jgi:hypothetical protein
MHRLPRWAAVLFALLGAAGQAGARPSDQPRRMPVGPPEAGTAAPAFPPPAAPPAHPPAAVTPDAVAPAVPNAPLPPGPAPGGKGAAAGRGDTRGAQAGTKSQRWRLFRRRSEDGGRPASKPASPWRR